MTAIKGERWHVEGNVVFEGSICRARCQTPADARHITDRVNEIIGFTQCQAFGRADDVLSVMLGEGTSQYRCRCTSDGTHIIRRAGVDHVVCYPHFELATALERDFQGGH